ncbi:MAG: hypothetical protein ACXQT4_02415 [Methanotrichaceae archaeon]
MIIGDATYALRKIRDHNGKRGIISVNPVNERNRKNTKKFAVERFFSWIEAFKKIYPRYERSEISYFGLVKFACIINIEKGFRMKSQCIFQVSI